MEEIRAEVLVVGAGVAGLCAALSAREKGVEVAVITLSKPGEANASAVSGGLVNAAFGIADPRDNPEEHFQDTVKAGRGINEKILVRSFVEGILRAAPRLESYGVNFTRENDHWLQILSPGHSYPRTLNFLPRRGMALTKPLVKKATETGVKFLPRTNVIKLPKKITRDELTLAIALEISQDPGAEGTVFLKDHEKINVKDPQFVKTALGYYLAEGRRTREPSSPPPRGSYRALFYGRRVCFSRGRNRNTPPLHLR